VVTYVVYIYCVFCKYANHDCVSQTVSINHGDECVLPLTIVMPSIFGEIFPFGEDGKDRLLSWNDTFISHQEVNLENQLCNVNIQSKRNIIIDSNSKSYL
jgi:hypothetical protein